MAMPKLVMLVLAILVGTGTAVGLYVESFGEELDFEPHQEVQAGPLSHDLLPMVEVPRPEATKSTACRKAKLRSTKTSAANRTSPKPAVARVEAPADDDPAKSRCSPQCKSSPNSISMPLGADPEEAPL